MKVYLFICLFVYLLIFPGVLIFVLGFLIDEALYFFHNKDNKKVLIIISIIIAVIVGGCISLKYTTFYKYYSDFHYVLNEDYCEEVQELKDIYVYEIRGAKLNTKTIYIETNDFKFAPSEYIVQTKDFARFKDRFKNCKKVRIKYLPNSKVLLWIEPVKS